MSKLNPLGPRPVRYSEDSFQNQREASIARRLASAVNAANADLHTEFANVDGPLRNVIPSQLESVTDLARALLPSAMVRLMDIIANSKSDQACVKAIEILFDRAFGKPYRSSTKEQKAAENNPIIQINFPEGFEPKMVAKIIETPDDNDQDASAE